MEEIKQQISELEATLAEEELAKSQGYRNLEHKKETRREQLYIRIADLLVCNIKQLSFAKAGVDTLKEYESKCRLLKLMNMYISKLYALRTDILDSTIEQEHKKALDTYIHLYIQKLQLVISDNIDQFADQLFKKDNFISSISAYIDVSSYSFAAIVNYPAFVAPVCKQQ